MNENEIVNIHIKTMLTHSEILATLVADVAQVKKVVGNGLGAQLKEVATKLDTFINHTKDKEIELKLREGKIDSENWFTRILNKSAGNIVLIAVTFIMINALVSSGVATFLKSAYSKEPPGQQAAILKGQGDIQSTLSGYHVHILKDGRTLYHSGDVNRPAWILNPTDNTWIKAPNMRTEKGIE